MALTKLTSVEFINFSEKFLRPMPGSAELTKLKNKTLYVYSAAFYLNPGIPEQLRCQHFDCLPSFLRETVATILAVYVMNHLTPAQTEGQPAITGKQLQFLLTLPIARSAALDGSTHKISRLCEMFKCKDLLEIISKTPCFNYCKLQQ